MWTSIRNVLRAEDTSVNKTTKRKKRFRFGLIKVEIELLQDEICRLQGKLDEAKRTCVKETRTSSSSEWERAAKQQRVETNKALHVKEQLQLPVRERAEHIERLKKLVFKTPQWNALPCITVQDVSVVIPADPAIRHAAMHRLADQLFARQQTMFIQAEALDLNQTVFKGEPIALPHDRLGFRFVNHACLPLPYQLFAHTCWNVMSAPYQVSQPRVKEYESWERVDVHTVYNKLCARRDNIPRHSNTVTKLYEERNRIVIVTSTASEDELIAREPSDMIEDVKSLWEFARHPEDSRLTNLTIVGLANVSNQMEHEQMKHISLTQVLSALQQLYVIKTGRFPSEPMIPIFEPFIERRRDFQD
ncbi:hypothetical protein AeMF1_006231 [Aphanomyces euteiches]|nr:hypothetical protein AeMF1_006231 [Aphanomyces euteiches]KAH9181890.1 hypothetical protein AeNC1_016133 [Aphanomyces euteiches]